MAAAALTDEGLALKKAMQGRIGKLATAAAAAEVRLMIDAEQSWLQPAIDNTVYSLQVHRLVLSLPASLVHEEVLDKDSAGRDVSFTHN